MGHGTGQTGAIPCSHQVIDQALPSILSETSAASKAITQSSGQPRLETESSTSETRPKLDDSSHLGVNEDPSLNPRSMTTSDWVGAQTKDKIVGEVIHLFKAKTLQNQKGKETDSQDMKHFIRK